MAEVQSPRDALRFIHHGGIQRKRRQSRNPHINGYKNVFRLTDTPKIGSPWTPTGRNARLVDNAHAEPTEWRSAAVRVATHDHGLRGGLTGLHFVVPSLPGSDKQAVVRLVECQAGEEEPTLPNDHNPDQSTECNDVLRAVQYVSPAHQMHGILEMYDREFCVLPLTMDCDGNPFRIWKDSCEEAQYVLHAVLAISAQHIAKERQDSLLLVRAHDHQSTALHLFREALNYAPAHRLLDTLLILINFEATQTASSAWDVHLNGARQLLEAMGGTRALHSSQRVRAQVAMLVWWDTTLCCLARRPTNLPANYLSTLLQFEKDDGWTFFALNGCPIDLVQIMARLAKLASTYETVLSLEHTLFDQRPVDDILHALRNWTNPEDLAIEETATTTVDLDLRRNSYHCIEAWRHAIHLYCLRVFDRAPTDGKRRMFCYLARIVLDHVRCIPRTAVMQKQTLLPLFLAAAEVTSAQDRDFAREYCAHWSLSARYSMFTTVLSLLEDIWSDADALQPSTYWWGLKVKHTLRAPIGTGITTTEHLLG